MIKKDKERVFGLDVIRALAILFVVISHSSYMLPEEVRKIIRYVEFDGVTLFFVLSGFLIGGILIRMIEEHGIRLSVLKRFWIRRWFRTLPAYFFVLVVIGVLNMCFTEKFTLAGVSRYFIFSQNLFTHHAYGFFPEAWSLSVEEWFYGLFPILLALISMVLPVSRKRNVLIACLVVAITVTLFRVYRYSMNSVEDPGELTLLFGRQVITRLDSLMYGVLGAYFHHFHFQAWVRYKKEWLTAGLLLLALTKYIMPLHMAPNGLYTCVLSYSFISIAALMVLPFLSQVKTYNGTFYKPVTYISLISYSMYLVHFTIVRRWIINKIDWTNFVDNRELQIMIKLGSYWILVFFLSVVMYLYVESPMTKLREKFS